MCHSEICQSNRSRGFIFVDKQHRGKKVENNETFFGDIFFCVEKKIPNQDLLSNNSSACGKM